MRRWRTLLGAVVAALAVATNVAPTAASAGAPAETPGCPRVALFSAHEVSQLGDAAPLHLWSTGGEAGDVVVFQADGMGEIGRTILQALPDDAYWSRTWAELAPSSLPRGVHRITATVEAAGCSGAVSATTFHVVYGGSDPAVDGAYAAVLGRPADETGLRHFSGRPMDEVVTALLASHERAEAVVRQVYRRYLSREPDRSGLAHWSARLRGGMAPEQLVTVVFGFDDLAGPPFLYEAFLDRAVTSAEAAYWANVWHSGRDPEPAIFASDEAQARAVHAAYRGLLGRNPDPQGQAYWTALLAGGWPSGDLIAGLLASPEYAIRPR